MRRLPASLSADALRIAWKQSPDSGPTAGAPGVDWVRPSAFGANLKDHILDLQSAIRTNAFRFSRLRLAPVPKASGGFRIIAIPTVRDRLVQRALLRHLESDSSFRGASTISYGFSRGKTLADAQRCARDLRNANPWMLQADIVRFFDRIPRPEVKVRIRRRVRSSKLVAELLSAAVDCELETSLPNHAKLVAEHGILKGQGLRQGMPVSPMLSNLLLREFDDLLQQKDIKAIRYADDIAIFGATKAECVRALEVVQGALAKLSLEVPELSAASKTHIWEPLQPALFLGVEIGRFEGGYRLTAPTKKLNDIEDSMAELATVERCLADRRNLGQVVRALDSFVVGHVASMAVLEDGGKFRELLEGRKQRQLKRLLVSILGRQTVSRLGNDKLAILGARQFDL